MNHVQKIIFISSFIITSSTYAKPSYIRSDLEQFNKTGACVNCDLSEVRLDSHDGANLSGALLVRADLSWFGPHHFYVSNFSHAQLMYANLDRVKASGSTP
jgi:uncharacterized protein YjbI with pentapeptide repeats